MFIISHDVHFRDWFYSHPEGKRWDNTCLLLLFSITGWHMWFNFLSLCTYDQILL